MDVAIKWTCPVCKKKQNASIRFRKDEKLDDKKLIQRRNKKTFRCLYCNRTFKYYSGLKAKLLNPNEAKLPDVKVENAEFFEVSMDFK